jgi:hypothetical protein
MPEIHQQSRKACDRFNDYGEVVNCEKGAVQLYPSRFIQEVADTVFWSVIYQHDMKAKNMKQRFADCITHYTNIHSGFCAELGEAFYLYTMPFEMRGALLGFNAKNFFTDAMGMGSGEDVDSGWD